MINKMLFLCCLVIITWGNLYSQDKNNDIVDIRLSSVPDTLNKNYFNVFVNISIKDGWHINSNKPLDDYLSPTNINLIDTAGITIIKIEYPPEMITKLQFSDSELSLYEGMANIKITLKVDDNFIKNKKKVGLELDYQSCNNQTCLFPVQKFISINL
jgi:thioredoxin:protein disulfide reductase